MKHTNPSYSASSEHLPTKKKSYPNGSAGKKYQIGKNTKTAFDGKKVSKKVHSNINFSKLDEVCLDVGKVDLSCSARLRNDSGLSPLKAPREWNGEINEVSFIDGHGDTDECTVHVSTIHEYENLKTIRSCYVQLESLGSTGKSSFGMGPRVCGTVFREEEDEEWKGWTSNISFSQQHGCPLVQIREESKVSEVLVLEDDLVDRECKIMEKCNGYKLNRNNFQLSFPGTCENDSERKFCVDKSFELKSKLQEIFEDRRELQSFFDSVDFSVSSPEFQTPPQNKSCIRKLSFTKGKIDVPSTSNGDVEVASEMALPNECLNCVEGRNLFVGFSEGMIYLSENYAKRYLDFYDRAVFKYENGMM